MLTVNVAHNPILPYATVADGDNKRQPCLLFPGFSYAKSLPSSALHQPLEFVTRGQETVAPSTCRVVDPNNFGLVNDPPAVTLRLAPFCERRGSDIFPNCRSLPADGAESARRISEKEGLHLSRGWFRLSNGGAGVEGFW